MKKKISLILILINFCLISPSQAEEVINPQLPQSVFERICPQKIWKSNSIYFSGVKDKRDSKKIGEQIIGKSPEPMDVNVHPSLEELLSVSMKRLASQCGAQFSNNASSPKSMTIEINDFFIDVTKKTFTSKAMAQSALTFSFTEPEGALNTVNINVSIENKKNRQKGLKQLEAVFSDLLIETLRQVASNADLKELL